MKIWLRYFSRLRDLNYYYVYTFAECKFQIWDMTIRADAKVLQPWIWLLRWDALSLKCSSYYYYPVVNFETCSCDDQRNQVAMDTDCDFTDSYEQPENFVNPANSTDLFPIDDAVLEFDDFEPLLLVCLVSWLLGMFCASFSENWVSRPI